MGLLAYAARYGHQRLPDLETMSIGRLRRLVHELHEIVRTENGDGGNDDEV